MSKLIRYSDGVVIEIAPNEGISPVSSVDFDRITETFSGAFASVSHVIKAIDANLKDVAATLSVARIKVEMGVNASAEGHLFVCKASTEATFKLAVEIVRRSEKNESNDGK
jgi:Trypsin-co-occurring domain 1